MVEIATDLSENTVGMVELFVEIAGVDPLSAAMLAIGAVLVGFSLGVFGLLSAGAVLATIRRLVPDLSAQPPQVR